MQGEIGIAQEFARHEDQVGLPVTHDFVGLLWRGDHANGAGEHSRFPPDALRKRNLISGTKRNRGMRRVAPRGAIHQIDAQWLEDRKSTRLNSSHLVISYAVFCLK